MHRSLPLLTLLLAGTALAAGPKSALVDATFIDGAQVVTGSPDLGQFPSSVAAVAKAAGGTCAKSEYVAWETVGGLEASFKKVLGSLGYTYAALNTSDQPGQHVVSFRATGAGGALAGIWADVDGTTLLGWCSVKPGQAAAPAKAPAALTPTAPTKAPAPAPAAKPAAPAPAAKPAAPAPIAKAPAARRGYVSGIVLDTQGRPLAGVEVYIYGTTFAQGQRTDFHVQTGADGTYTVRVPDGRYRADATLTKDYAGATFELKLHPESGSDKTEVDSTGGGTLNFRWRLTGSKPGGGKDWSDFYGASIDLSYCGLPASAYCDRRYTDLGAAAPGGSTVTLTFTPQGKLVDGTAGQPVVMTFKASPLRTDYPSAKGGGRLVLGQTWQYQSENINDLPLGVYTMTASATTPDGRKLPLKVGLEQGDVDHGSVTLKWSAYDITRGLKQLRVYIRD
ncbi:hypothetical protein HNQ07_001552 [Deinococcus metalli]|uniref:Carboxypeptidase regulatory-like domain-containing protein n=1 Tax=Deinococcus metalli TaxID=1141878 RepID=A0A7W8KDT1_9DEIO|nr:carboxypeptidase-like regulatory domain-containing protein [Deinococcus metalli]MBB5376095.1 hypothetical protein [Deinococcus metalli]GHF40832.1 hypothetical protein GCM10017781_16880 [Deinococcus metalli]